MKTHVVKLLITFFLQCEGSSWLRQPDYKPMETFNNPIGVSRHVVLPSVVSDLPRARDILPGHTLIRPDMDSLRSAISIGNNERIINTGFRRSRRDYDSDEDGGDEAPGKKYLKKVNKDSSDENYLNFKSDIVYNPSQNFLINNCQPDSYGNTASCSPQKKPKPKNSKKVYVLGAMFMEENEGVMRSKFPNTRKDYNDMGIRNIDKKLIPVHSKYIIILADDEPAKKQEEIKFDKSKEEGIGKINVNSDKIVEFSNAREQPIPKRGNVLRAAKLKPVPVLINPGSRSEERKKYDVPPQRLLDYLNTRSDFDHVKISDRAPTIQQLVPNSPSDDNNNKRKWWFYNQDDYKPFLN
ncbi:uncharacterized protein LOC121729223 isoform X2 [Aricia agestis]|uniref:uncharacterized protein LOC121729223 isoform X2 n=1 Tax=Aricia agestis TaxID=91739 RepID=UPI001C206E9A|nr:uncharacterized protein LOC121729223 isoform X2 [Aricia agestis]